MDRSCIYWKFWVLMFVSPVIRGNPTENFATCSRAQCQDSGKFHFMPSTSYSYRYEVDVSTFVQGTNNEQSRFHFTSKVHLDFQSKCDVILRITDGSLRDSEPADVDRKSEVKGEKDFLQPLEQYPLQFSFHDGLISHICPHNDDPIWSVNIKRGILSSLQNTVQRFDLDYHTRETDVTGTCQVHYTLYDKQHNSLILLKTRDLTTCSHRYNHLNSLMGVPYHFVGSYDGLPILNSTSTCQQSIANYRIMGSECEETHMLRPFSENEAGVKTTVLQRLTSLRDEILEDKAVSVEITKRSSLLYEHELSLSADPNERGSLNILQQLCQKTEDGIEPEAAALFGRLVNTLRLLNFQSLTALLSKAEDLCRDGIATKLLLDGLISASTSAAVAAMRDEVATGKVDERLVQKWTSSLNFIPNPDENHLVAALPVLDLPPSVRPHQAALSISSLARRICMKRDCNSIPEVLLLVNVLSQPLGSSCQTRSREEREEVLLALKSLGNIGSVMKNDVLQTIESCYMDRDNPAEVRVTALQSLRNVPCSSKKDSVFKLLKNTQEDSEIRIMAYLTLMACPTYATVMDIKHLLMDEEVNQVGSFIWTHMQNLVKTSLPSKQAIQGLITDQSLIKKFDTDGRKFSRNYEYSIFLDDYNAAAAVESNVIFSSSSYIPRSASVNLTVDLFGQSIHLFEIGGRFQGFEQYVESLFGPNGVYHQNEIKNVLQNLRSKRRVNPVGLNNKKLNHMEKEFSAAKSFEDNPEMSLSMKLLGSEVHYGHWEGTNEIVNLIRNLNPISTVQNLFNQGELDYSRATQLMDMIYVVPLAAGFPLNLTARSHAIVNIKGNIQTKLQSLLASGRGEIKWNIHPSAAVHLDAAMMVDAKQVKTGVKLAGNLHSSVATSGHFAIDGFNLIDFQVDLPQDKVDIINVKSEIILEHRHLRTSLSGIQENRIDSEACTRGFIQRYLGLRICGSFAYPNTTDQSDVAHFPLTGPSLVSLSLEKVDPAITTYRFLHMFENSLKKKIWKLTFQPRGSKETKEIGLDVGVNFEDATGRLYLLLPNSDYKIDGKFKLDGNVNEAEASFMWHGNSIMLAKASLNKFQRQRSVVYQPKLTFILKEKDIASMSGEVSVTEKKGIPKYDGNIILNMGSWKVDVKGYHLLDERSQVSNITLEYRSGPSRPERLNIEVKLNNGTTKAVRQYETHLDVQSSAYPQYNFAGSWKLQQGHGLLENRVSLSSGVNNRNSRSKLTINQGLIYTSTSHGKRLKSKFEVTLPSKGIDAALIFGYEKTSFKYDTHFVGRYAPGRELHTGILVKRKPGIFLHAEGTFNLTLPSQPVVMLRGHVQEQPKNQYTVSAEGILGQNTDFKVNGDYVNNIQGFDFDHQLNLTITGKTFHPIGTFLSLTRNHTPYQTHTSRSRTNNALYKMQFRTNFGKDAVSFNLDYEQASEKEIYIGTQFGYLDSLHSANFHWKSGTNIQASLDIQIDKIRDIRGDFAITNDPSGRTESLLEFRWDANRNPLQKWAIKTSSHSTVENPWDGTILFIYPGQSIKGTISTLIQDNKQSLVASVDVGSKEHIKLTAWSLRQGHHIDAEVFVDTIYSGWEHSKAKFKSDTTPTEHETKLSMLWNSDQFFNFRLEAEYDRNHLGNVQLNLEAESSISGLEHLQTKFQTQLEPGICGSSMTIKWRNDREIKTGASVHWDVRNQFLFGWKFGLTTPFPYLTKAKIEMFHNTQWSETLLSETTCLLELDALKYTLVLKGENPGSQSRWEASAYITTPHADYERLGLTSIYQAGPSHPSFVFRMNWPRNEVGFNFGVHHDKSDQYRAHVHVVTPFSKLSDALLAIQYKPVDPLGIEFDIETRWNKNNTFGFNTSIMLDSGTNSRLSIHLRTPIESHEKYGLDLGLTYDLNYKLDAIARAIFPTKQVGFNVTASINEEDHTTVTVGTVILELPEYPEMKLDMIKLDKDDRTSSIEAVFSQEAKTITTIVDYVIKENNSIDIWIRSHTPYRQMKEMDVRASVSAHDFQLLTFKSAARWRYYDEDLTGELDLKWINNEEEMDNFDTKSMTQITCDIKLPWFNPKRIGIQARLQKLNSQINGTLEFVYSDYRGAVKAEFDLLNEKSVISATFKTPSLVNPSSYRMNSTWGFERDAIRVEGTIETPHPAFRLVPWNIVYSSNDTEENAWEKTLAVQLELPKLGPFLLNLRFSPEQVTGDLTTPFGSVKKANLYLTYKMDSESGNLQGTVQFNEKTLEISCEYKWSEEDLVPYDLQLTLVTPFQYKDIALNWKLNQNETYTDVAFSLTWNDQSIQLNFDLNTQPWDSLNTEYTQWEMVFKLDTPFVDYENWMFRFTLQLDDPILVAKLLMATPFETLRSVNVEISTTVSADGFELSTILETTRISSNFRVVYLGQEDGILKREMKLHIQDLCSLLFSFANDDEFTQISAETKGDWTDVVSFGAKTSFRRQDWSKWDWNLVITSKEREWKSALGVDFIDFPKSSNYNLMYESVHNQLLYRTYGSLVTKELQRIATLVVDWKASRPLELKAIMETKEENLGIVDVHITSPWMEEPILVAKLITDRRQTPHTAQLELYGPRKVMTSKLNLKYNYPLFVDCNIVATTTYRSLPSVGLHLKMHRIDQGFNGTYALQWSEVNKIDVDLSHQQSAGNLLQKKDFNGAIKVKTTWSSLPEASLRYSRTSKNPTETEFVVNIGHNYTDIINVLCTTTSHSSAGKDIEGWQFETRNIYFSTGAAYTYTYEYSGGENGMNFPTALTRTGEIYDVDNRKGFFVRLSLIEKETFSDVDTALELVTPIRTIRFRTYCNQPNDEFHHGSEFQWSPQGKISYSVTFENKTTDSRTDYIFLFTLNTPVRSIGLSGTIRKTQRNLRMLNEIVWDLKRKESAAKITVNWENVTESQSVQSQRIRVGFSQGQLPRELVLLAEIHQSPTVPLNARVEVQYSNEPERNVVMTFLTTSGSGQWRTEMNVTHPISELDVKQVLAYECNSRRLQLLHSFSHQRKEWEPVNVDHLLTVDFLESKLYFSGNLPSQSLRHQGHIIKNGPVYLLHYETQYNEDIPKIIEMNYNQELPLVHLVAQYDPENVKGFHFKAGIPDKRHIMLDIFQQWKEEHIPLLDFVFRLNHSRLVTSSLKWRPNLKTEISDWMLAMWNKLQNDMQDWIGLFAITVISESLDTTAIVWDDVSVVLESVLDNFGKEMQLLGQDIERWKQIFIDSYQNNAFFIKTAIEVGGAIIQDIPFGSYAQNFVTWIEKTGDRILLLLTGKPNHFSPFIKQVYNKLTTIYEVISGWFGEQIKWPSEKSVQVMEQISELLYNIAQEYDKFLKRLQQNCHEMLQEIEVQAIEFFDDSWNDVYKIIQPTLLRIGIATENAVWNVLKDVLEYIYGQREAVVNSTYFQWLSQFMDDISTFYKDMQSTNWPANVQKYLSRISYFFQQKYSEIHQHFLWVDYLVKQIRDLYTKILQDNPELEKVAEGVTKFRSFLWWSIDRLGIHERIHMAFVNLREKGWTVLRQTATEAQMRYRLDNTVFRYDFDTCEIIFRQKLPFPWISLDQAPRYTEIPEIENIRWLMSLFKSSNTTLLDYVFSFIPAEDVSDWLPPFKGTAHLIGLQNYVTFDGRHFEFAGPCTYVLSSDLYSHSFTLALQYVGTRGKPYASVLQLTIDEAQWDLDMANQSVRVAGNRRDLPTEERGTIAYLEHGKYRIHSPSKGILLECTAAFEVCSFTLSGWYNNKVAGLFGTMDNEPSTDLIRPDRIVDSDLTSLARSWDVSLNEECKTVDNLARKIYNIDEQLMDKCKNFFSSSRSSLRPCFSAIDPTPYLHICSNNIRKMTIPDGCHAAAAYVQACAAKGIYVTIPSVCLRCNLDGNQYLTEGEIKTVHQEKVRSSTDVVVIIELKDCNENVKMRRSISSILNQLEKEFNANKIIKNRYAVVVFGGNQPYDTPRIRTSGGRSFVALKDMDNLLHNLPHGNGVEGALSAIDFASQLQFRPGVSKTLILVPCSSCEVTRKVDYGTLSQQLLEQDFSLHVLMEQEFRLSKANASKQFLGVDASFGFTRKDFRSRVMGDIDLRRQAKLPKSALGLCSNLALELNGTIFTISKMREHRRGSAETRRAISVWAKRVASTANPSSCHNCICSLKHHPHSNIECLTCSPRRSPVIDTSFLVEDDALPRAGKSVKNREEESEESRDRDEGNN